jgi:hypothetical protein
VFQSQFCPLLVFFTNKLNKPENNRFTIRHQGTLFQNLALVSGYCKTGPQWPVDEKPVSTRKNSTD